MYYIMKVPQCLKAEIFKWFTSKRCQNMNFEYEHTMFINVLKDKQISLLASVSYLAQNVCGSESSGANLETLMSVVVYNSR